jgi:hypothetical protein
VARAGYSIKILDQSFGFWIDGRRFAAFALRWKSKVP